MGLASNQARLNVLTLRKSDLEARLTILTTQELNLALQKGDEIAKKNEAMQAFYGDDANVEANFTEQEAYLEYEDAMDQLEEAEIKLDQQKQLVETEHTAIVAEKEEIKKLVDDNVKDSFKYFD